jgi:type VI secretion system protein ImpH
MGRKTDPLTFFEAVRQAPFNWDFYQALRRLETLYPGRPRIGQALRPADEPIRLGQEPSLSFAPAALSALDQGYAGKPPRLRVRFFGLFGPNGPLPLHLTEYARDRLLHFGDPTFPRFLDIFHHRFLALFYRAWAQGQPTVSLDRPGEDPFSRYVAALIGLGTAGLRGRDAAHDFAKLHFSGLLARHVRNAEGLHAVLGAYFRLPCCIQQFVAHWLHLPREQRSRLGEFGGGAFLGRDAVIGTRVWDRQHKFRIRLGPLTLSQYESFLPGGANLRRLVDWVRFYFCFEFEWDVRLALARGEVPETRPGRYGRLGWTTWLGTRRSLTDAEDLVLDAEAVSRRAASAQTTV